MKGFWIAAAIATVIAIRPQLVARSADGNTLFGNDDDRGLLRMVRVGAVLACPIFLYLQFVPE